MQDSGRFRLESIYYRYSPNSSSSEPDDSGSASGLSTVDDFVEKSTQI